MSAGEDEGTGFGPVIWVMVLCIIGALVLVAFFMPKDTTTFFLGLNEKFNDFFESPFFVMAKFISGIIIVILTALLTWLFFKLLEMEKEHEEHVYHHAHSEEDHQPKRNATSPSTGHDSIGLIAVDQTKPLTETQSVSRTKTAPPPVRLPGESGVRGSQAGEQHAGHFQWQSVLRLATSNNPSDWKLAIIEADVILDMMTYMQGFPGQTLGERLKNADVGYFKTLKYAKQAHYVRNQIAHEADLQLTPRDVNQTIRMYEAVFTEFKYI